MNEEHMLRNATPMPGVYLINLKYQEVCMPHMGYSGSKEQLLKETRHSMAGAFIVTAEENFLTFEYVALEALVAPEEAEKGEELLCDTYAKPVCLCQLEKQEHNICVLYPTFANPLINLRTVHSIMLIVPPPAGRSSSNRLAKYTITIMSYGTHRLTPKMVMMMMENGSWYW
ncbi:hypothetical protein RRG08_043766 [Elysia crispata]|uniref:Uncharacterized protein n=1 Tax=Elysia crispata TaxID=231223 RepID=A0AAE1EBQ6_9GAST|nr:hypothetical protein RRG08_043766 [Elysia crispata]